MDYQRRTGKKFPSDWEKLEHYRKVLKQETGNYVLSQDYIDSGKGVERWRLGFGVGLGLRIDATISRKPDSSLCNLELQLGYLEQTSMGLAYMPRESPTDEEITLEKKLGGEVYMAFVKTKILNPNPDLPLGD